MQRDLLGELSAVEALFYGAHAAVSAELGHVPDPAQELHSGAGKEADEITFRQWAAALYQDGDLSRDVRMMVPVFYDVQRRKTKVWVVLGWAERPANIYFNKPPAARVTDPSGKDASSKVRLEYQGTYRQVCYPVSAEVYVDRLMDRDEFRRHCDRYRTRSAILKNLR